MSQRTRIRNIRDLGNVPLNRLAGLILGDADLSDSDLTIEGVWV